MQTKSYALLTGARFILIYHAKLIWIYLLKLLKKFEKLFINFAVKFYKLYNYFKIVC